VATGWGTPADGRSLEESTFPGGAAARRDEVGWVLADVRPHRALGSALVWADHAGVDQLHLLVDDHAGLLARRATAFEAPPTVWRVLDGGAVVVVGAEPVAERSPLAPEVAAFASRMIEAGADVVVEDGILRGEVLGLEVARVVVDDDRTRLEIGVGHHDREAQRMLQGEEPTVAALAAAVTAVRNLRRADAPSHPMNQLAQERWLRTVVVARPEMTGAAELTPVASTMRPDDLRQASPAAAVGVDGEGRPVIVVCSTGIDLDLVPVAADVRLADPRPDVRLILLVPEPDAHPVTHQLAARLTHPAQVVTVPDDWKSRR